MSTPQTTAKRPGRTAYVAVRCLCEDGRFRTRKQLADNWSREFRLTSDVIHALLPIYDDLDELTGLCKLVDDAINAACMLHVCDPIRADSEDFTFLREGYKWLKARGHAPSVGSRSPVKAERHLQV